MDTGRTNKNTYKTLGVKPINTSSSQTQYVNPCVPTAQLYFSGRPSPPPKQLFTRAGRLTRTETISPPCVGVGCSLVGELNHTTHNKWQYDTDKIRINKYHPVSHKVIKRNHKWDKKVLDSTSNFALNIVIYNSILLMLTRQPPLNKHGDFMADLRSLADNTANQASNILHKHWKLEKSRGKELKSHCRNMPPHTDIRF